MHPKWNTLKHFISAPASMLLYFQVAKGESNTHLQNCHPNHTLSAFNFANLVWLALLFTTPKKYIEPSEFYHVLCIYLVLRILRRIFWFGSSCRDSKLFLVVPFFDFPQFPAFNYRREITRHYHGVVVRCLCLLSPATSCCCCCCFFFDMYNDIHIVCSCS